MQMWWRTADLLHAWDLILSAPSWRYSNRWQATVLIMEATRKRSYFMDRACWKESVCVRHWWSCKRTKWWACVLIIPPPPATHRSPNSSNTIYFTGTMCRNLDVCRSGPCEPHTQCRSACSSSEIRGFSPLVRREACFHEAVAAGCLGTSSSLFLLLGRVHKTSGKRLTDSTESEELFPHSYPPSSSDLACQGVLLRRLPPCAPGPCLPAPAWTIPGFG